MKTLKLWSFLILLLPGSIAFAQREEIRRDDVVMVRVNSGVIMRSAFESACREVLDEFRRKGLTGAELERQLKEWKPRILDELIDRQFLVQQAQALSIDLRPEADRLLLLMREENRCESTECLKRKLREVGFDLEEVRRVMAENLAIDALLEREVYDRIRQTVAESEKRLLYEENKAAFIEPAVVRLSVIFVSFGQDSDQALRSAQEISIQTRGGNADFATLARRYPAPPAGINADELNPVVRIGALRPEIRVSIENASLGTITDPIRLENGYYVFRVEERSEAKVLPFEDEWVQNSINGIFIARYGEERLKAYLVGLRLEADIQIDPRYQLEYAEMKPARIIPAPSPEEREKKRDKIKRRKNLMAKLLETHRPNE